MKMKTKIILAIVAVLIAAGAIVLVIINSKKGPTLICDYPSKYTNYTEQLKFEFRENMIEKFYRIEKFTETDKDKLDEEETYFKKAKESYKEDLGTYVKYNLNRDKNSITITTYIYVPRRNSFFDNYMKSKEIYHFMNVDMIKTSLEEEGYSCTVKK